VIKYSDYMRLVETAIDTLLRRPPRYREIKAKNDMIKFSARATEARNARKKAKDKRYKKKAQAAIDRADLERARSEIEKLTKKS
jgi:hypothetical protein